jgi:hypothetical protein
MVSRRDQHMANGLTFMLELRYGCYFNLYLELSQFVAACDNIFSTIFIMNGMIHPTWIFKIGSPKSTFI